VFRYDTCVEMKAYGKLDKLKELMAKIYCQEEIQSRIEAIKVRKAVEMENDLSDYERRQSPLNWTWRQTFCDFRFRKAAWVGCAGAAF
jgi:hypothetical protein